MTNREEAEKDCEQGEPNAGESMMARGMFLEQH